MTFYNTIGADNQTMITFDQQVKNQEDRVYRIFLEQNKSMTTREVYALYLKKHEPTTPIEWQTPFDSIKRSVTDLTTEQKLIKNPKSEMVKGTKGKPNYTWKLK